MERLPQQVLVGTDVEPLSRYLAHAQPVQPGKYSVEIGGALLQARITTGAAPSLKRQFKEPGLKASTITYSSLRALGSSLVSERVQIIGLPDAALVFEQNSGLEGIPNTMWIRYEREGVGHELQDAPSTSERQPGQEAARDAELGNQP